MQLQLAFVEHPMASTADPANPWGQIDPSAQIKALEILGRLIAQSLAANLAEGTSDE